jgi:hypothetical protein
VRLAVLITVIALAVLMIAAAVGPYFVPTKTYQVAVEKALAEKLDARVVIDKFKLRLIPYPGYTIEGFVLVSDRSPFRGMPVVEAKKVIGSLSFGALFGGDLDTEVEARDVGIYIRSQRGVSNVEMMFGHGSPAPAGEAEPFGTQEPLPEAGPGRAPSRGAEEPEPDVPDAPVDAIPSMPAPAIEVPTEGQQGQQSFFRDLILREAFAASEDGQGRSITLSQFDIVRGRIEIVSDEGPAPVVINDVSIAAKDLSLEGGFSGSFKMTGRMEGEPPSRVSVEGGLVLDDKRLELTLRGVRVLFGNTQFVVDATIGYGMKPALVEAHIASPNVTGESLAPALAYLGWKLPGFLSWDGTLGVDISYRGTRLAGQLGLQVDATPARVRLGEGFLKEPGLTFKVQTDIIVKPESMIIGRGTLSLEGSDIKLSGDVMRDGDMEARLGARGDELALPALRSLLPWLPDMDSLEGGRVDLMLAGALLGAKGLSSSGRLEASRVIMAGTELGDFSAMFTREEDEVEVTTLRGEFAGGDFSGNGHIDLGDEPGMKFDIVMGGVDTKDLASLKGAVDGKASMVIKVASFGADRVALLENLTISGSFVATEAAIKGIESAAGAFSEETWDAIAQNSAATLSEAAVKELEASSESVSNLKASFEMTGEGTEVESVTWVSKLYSADLAASVSPAGELAAEGALAIDKSASAKLIAEAGARKKLIDTKGRLIVPVKGEGSLADPKLSIDADELAAIIDGRTKPKPMLEMVKKEEEAKEKAETEGAFKALEAPSIDMESPPTTVIDAPITEEKKEPTRKRASRPKARREAPAGSSSGSDAPDQSVDDILKVIIGN